MDLDHEIVVELDHEQLAAPPDALEPPSRERRQRRIERLQRVDPGSERRLDLGAGDGSPDQARGDFDLG